MATVPRLSGGLLRTLAMVLVGVLIIVALVTLLRPSAEQKLLTASFPRTVSIYEGSAVRVLGVPIGKVETVEPAGTTVKVTMQYDPEVKVPADAKAVVVAPSVVGDRFIQLTPVYQGGPTLEDGARLDTDRTAIPLELDQIYANISELTSALGPDGANKDGALTRLLDSTARNFGGQGEQFNQTIRDLSRFTTTLDNNKEELFGTAREIERFVQALAENDQTVRDFNDSLASASTVLETEREELAASLRNLGVAMQQVSSFVKDNRDALSRNIKGLVTLTNVLVKQRAALDETLSAAPVALANLYHTYNPTTGTLDTRSNLGENVSALEKAPLSEICQAVTSDDGPLNSLCDALEAGAKQAGLLRSGALRGAGAGSQDHARQSPPLVIEPIDTTLAGIVGGDR